MSSMNNNKKLTKEDHVILNCVQNAESLKEGMEIATKKLESNFYRIKNRYYNHILPLIGCGDNPNYEFDDYFNAQEILLKDVDPFKASEVVMNIEVFQTLKKQMHQVGNTGIKIAFMFDELKKENDELKKEVKRLTELLQSDSSE